MLGTPAFFFVLQYFCDYIGICEIYSLMPSYYLMHTRFCYSVLHVYVSTFVFDDLA